MIGEAGLEPVFASMFECTRVRVFVHVYPRTMHRVLVCLAVFLFVQCAAFFFYLKSLEEYTVYKVLTMMEDAGLEPDACSYNVLLDACARAASVRGSRGRVEEGIQVLTRMQDAGVKADIVSYNSLLNTCAKAAGVWGSVGVSQASRIIEMMGTAGVKPDITSFNCLLNAYAQAAGAGQMYQPKDIFEVLGYMKAEGIPPDLYSYNTVMNICAKSAKTGARAPQV